MGIKYLTSSGTAGNAVSSFTVPSGKVYRVHWAHVTITHDATTPARRGILSQKDADGTTMIDNHGGASDGTASAERHHTFMTGIYRETSFIDGELQIPIPEFSYIPPGGTLEISFAGGTATDSFDVYACVEELPAVAVLSH